jgi:2,2-dialkylglycine decarboxylase (pyruvate)
MAAARLASVTPGDLNKVIFLSTGSEANECAMRIAKAVTGRTGMLAYSRGYYGISLATRNLSSISDHPGKVDFQPSPINQYKLVTPMCNRCPIGLEHSSCNLACLDVSLEMIGQHQENIAAVIVEPILSAGGMIFPPEDYLQKLYQSVHKMGALFIADEAQTGFGRCARWFDVQNYKIEPDILVVSKTAGNGYPAAAVIVSDRIADNLESQSFTHLSSHQNDPLAATIVGAVIDIVEEENLLEHSRKAGAYFVDQLRSLQPKHPIVSDVRGRGLMIGLELSDRMEPKRTRNIAFEMALLCERRGLHITYSYYEPVMRIIPPLIISYQEIDAAVHVIDDALTTLEKEPQHLSSVGPQNVRSGPYIKQMNNSFSATKLLHKMWRTSPQQWLGRFKKLF